MNLKIAVRGSALILLLSAGACATPSRFEFGSYDSSLYVYSKKPEQAIVFENSLQQAIKRGVSTNRLAPGLHAELGYCYLKDGKKKEAIEEFRAEITAFPESKPFLDTIIAQNDS